ncbi:helix-turn-helix domain-containing protein [Sphingobium sp.]
MTCTHLSREERYQIQALFDGLLSYREIAEQLDRSPSTIAR